MFTSAEIEALRAKYRAERDRRIRPNGGGQYRQTAGEFGYYAKGSPLPGNYAFGPGPIAFHDLLRTWRADSMEQVLWNG